MVPDPRHAAVLAERLHAAAIHLLRRLRTEDRASGIPPARLSALSVLVFAGPRSLNALAEAEQVRPPTMSRIVAGLEGGGYVRREVSSEDARAVVLHPTAKGRRALLAARRRRLARLVALMRDLGPREVADLERGIASLQALLRRG